MPASKMSLTARLTMRSSVLVSELRPVYFLLSLDVFQMHAITDALPATERQTQIDRNAIHNSSTTDMDEDDAILRTITYLLSLPSWMLCRWSVWQNLLI